MALVKESSRSQESGREEDAVRSFPDDDWPPRSTAASATRSILARNPLVSFSSSRNEESKRWADRNVAIIMVDRLLIGMTAKNPWSSRRVNVSKYFKRFSRCVYSISCPFGGRSFENRILVVTSRIGARHTRRVGLIIPSTNHVVASRRTQPQPIASGCAPCCQHHAPRQQPDRLREARRDGREGTEGAGAPGSAFIVVVSGVVRFDDSRQCGQGAAPAVDRGAAEFDVVARELKGKRGAGRGQEG